MRKQEVRGYEKSMGVGKPNPQIQESERYEIKDAAQKAAATKERKSSTPG
jgi:hypothetical protein